MSVIALGVSAQTFEEMYGEFKRVPDSTRTKVWWFHGENKTTAEGITADLEAYRRAGVGGVVWCTMTSSMALALRMRCPR